MRETVRGVLHGSVIRKHRASFLDHILIDALLDMGKVTYDDRKIFYAPRYYLTPLDGEDRVRLWSFKGQPKALSLDHRGHVVTVKATLEFWSNNIGAHLLRPEILDVSDERAPNHECDSPRSCESMVKAPDA